MLQCVELVRILKIIKQLGIEDDDIYNFLNKLYTEYNSPTLQPIE